MPDFSQLRKWNNNRRNQEGVGPYNTEVKRLLEWALNAERRLDWYSNLRTKIQDCPPENSPITGHFWRKNTDDKVTVAQIREFVNTEMNNEEGYRDVGTWGMVLLDFIDNGPKKPTAEEIVEKCIENGYPYRFGLREDVVRSLREASLLKEDS